AELSSMTANNSAYTPCILRCRYIFQQDSRVSLRVVRHSSATRTINACRFQSGAPFLSPSSVGGPPGTAFRGTCRQPENWRSDGWLAGGFTTAAFAEAVSQPVDPASDERVRLYVSYQRAWFARARR